MLSCYAPLVARYPILSALPDEALGRLECRRCSGAGRIGDDADGRACSECRGTGLVCPRCSGAGWVVDHASGTAGHRATLRCPACLTPDGRTATILGFVAETNRTLTDDQPVAA